MHRVAEPREARLIPGALEPLVERALRLEGEAERGGVPVLRAPGRVSAREEPVRERAVDLGRLVCAAVWYRAGVR